MKILSCAFLLALSPALCAQTVSSSGGINVNGATTLGPVPSTFFQPTVKIDYALLDSLMLKVAPPIIIHPEDRLGISVFGVPDYTGEGRVEADGTMQLPYIGSVPLAGLTVTEAEKKIASELITKDLVVDPAVKISVAEQPSTFITISGEVVRPSTYPAFGRQTLADLIARSGGLLNTASPYASLVRKGFAAPIIIPLGNDPSKPSYSQMPLIAGDEVTISKIGVFYVVGAVKSQGAYALKNATAMTVSQAIASAGGYGFEALLDSAKIVRTEGDHRVLLSVHAGKILRGKEKDVALENDDILFIPTSEFKAAVKGGATGLIVSLASTYIYAHP